MHQEACNEPRTLGVIEGVMSLAQWPKGSERELPAAPPALRLVAAGRAAAQKVACPAAA